MPPRRRGRHAAPTAVPPRTRLREVPAAVWLLTLAFTAWLLANTVLAPLYSAPDEPAHVDLVLALRDGHGYPALGDRDISRAVEASYEVVGRQLPDGIGARLAADAPPRGRRPTFAELPAGATDQLNQMPQHPPLYYALLTGAYTAVVTFVPGGVDVVSADQTVALLRILGGVLLVAPTPLLAYLAARRLAGPGAVALTAAVVPTVVPQLAHLGGSVNNDNLLVLLVGALTVGVAGVLVGDTSWRLAAVAGALGGAALLTKAFALFVPAYLLAAYAVAAWRGRDPRAMLPGALAIGTSCAIGGWWWVRNLVLHGTIQPPGSPWDAAEPGFVPTVGEYLSNYAKHLTVRFWGWSGREGDPLHGELAYVAAGVVLVCLVAAFVARRRPLPRVDTFAMIAPVFAILAMLTVTTWQVYAYSSCLCGQQGRYTFPAIVGLAVATAGGAVALARHRAPALALLAGAVLQGDMALGVMRRYWGETPPALDGSVAALLAWSPWPPGVVAGVFGAAAVTALVAVVAVLRADRTVAAAPVGVTSPGRLDRLPPTTAPRAVNGSDRGAVTVDEADVHARDRSAT